MPGATSDGCLWETVRSSICAEKQLLCRKTMPRHEQSTRDINTD